MTHEIAFGIVLGALVGAIIVAAARMWGESSAELSAVRSANAGRPHTFGTEEYRLVLESKYVVMEARERAYLDALARRREEVVRDVARSAGPLVAGQVASDLQHVDNDSVASMPPLSDFVRDTRPENDEKASDLHESPIPPDEDELQYGEMRGDLSHNSTVVPMRIGDIPTSPREGPLMVRVRLPKDPTGEPMLHSGGEFSVEVVGEGVQLPVRSVTIERTGPEDIAVVKLEMFHFDLDAELLPVIERIDVRCADGRCGVRFGVIDRLDFDRIEWSACEKRADGSFRQVPGEGSATMLAFAGLEWGKVSVGDVVPLFWRGTECLYGPPVGRARPDDEAGLRSCDSCETMRPYPAPGWSSLGDFHHCPECTAKVAAESISG